jgi:CRISPR-associated endonuclease Csn1
VPELLFDRNEVMEKLRNIVVSFKPDHGKEGKLSLETALGHIKLEELVPVHELTPEDIPHIKNAIIRDEFENALAINNKFRTVVKELAGKYPLVQVFRSYFVNRTNITTLKTEKNLNSIVDPYIQKQLRGFIAENPNEKFDQLVTKFSEQTGIKRVRCKTFAQTPIVIPPHKGNPFPVTRYYNPADYLAVVIWEIPPEKDGGKPAYQGQYVRRTEIRNDNSIIEKKPQSAARKVCELFKNDYIEFSQNGIWKKARIASYSATVNSIDIRPIYAANDIYSWIVATAEPMLERGWKLIAGQNFVSINVLFGALSARKIIVSPIGEVSRKTKT